MTVTENPSSSNYERLPDVSPIGAPLDWKWLRGAKSEWGVKPKPGPRGLTMMDIAVGSYGDVPDNPPHRSMAPRGADVDPDTPDMGYILNKKSDVWADNVVELYEEAVARQWSATRTSLNELPELPSDLGHAMCQVCTTLTEVEMIASDLPAKWMWRMNHDFIETKMFLCADHGRGPPRRGSATALANGGSLLMSRGQSEGLLHHSRGQDLRRPRRWCTCWARASSGHLPHGRLISRRRWRSACSAWPCRTGPPRGVRRHTSGRWSRTRTWPRRSTGADHGEPCSPPGTSRTSGPLAVLLGGGVGTWRTRAPLQIELQRKQFTSYLARCERAGISRLHRTTLPLELLGIDPETVLAN